MSDPTCSNCHQFVAVDSLDEWEEGDVCWRCGAERAYQLHDHLTQANARITQLEAALIKSPSEVSKIAETVQSWGFGEPSARIAMLEEAVNDGINLRCFCPPDVEEGETVRYCKLCKKMHDALSSTPSTGLAAIRLAQKALGDAVLMSDDTGESAPFVAAIEALNKAFGKDGS